MGVAPAAAPTWYADGLSFGCTQCGNCCSGPPGYVYVSDAEIAELAAWLGVSAEEFTRRHTHRVGRRRSLHERDGGDCEFLQRDPSGKTRCTVHAARPVQCRTWPFWQSNLESPEAWASAGRTCPGINRGAHHPLPVIQTALQRNAELGLRL